MKVNKFWIIREVYWSMSKIKWMKKKTEIIIKYIVFINLPIQLI